MSLAVILIIAHKEIPSKSELASLDQCYRILGKHPIFLICPSGLDVSAYLNVIPSIKVDYIDPKWQSTYKMFNRLKVSPFLYQKYSQYEYVLFYELDSWVFRDELEFWCDKGYDYIGAPWINTDIYRWLFIKQLYPVELKLVHSLTKGKNLNLVGNGGFSLRKTKSMIRNTKLFSFRGTSWNANEDSFFSHYVGTFNIFFKLPDFSKALKFSFDVNPELAYKMNNYQLPFGCHGFSRTDEPHYSGHLSFWKAFIQLSDSGGEGQK